MDESAYFSADKGVESALNINNSEDTPLAQSPGNASRNLHHNNWFLALGALGVVFGDIGTSPLYAFRECFAGVHNLRVNPDNVLGVLSLIFWTLVVVICVKYMAFVMRADNKGEGGILALMALASRGESASTHPRRKWAIVALGLFGAALLYGDGIITPAISVLSAVEGMKILTPVFDPFVVPLTVLIIVVLFLFQFFGTGRLGSVFGPIIMVWFFCIGGLGLKSMVETPAVMVAVNPFYAYQFLLANSELGFLVLGSVFLVVTGGEALYADMGHFGRHPIRLAWFLLAMPALVLNYFGQGALLLRSPEAVSNPFYLLTPAWAMGPMVVLATTATVIASQALISGVFSLTKQAIQLGFAPRLRIVHTSSWEIGQVYIPFVNWALMVGVVWLVISFKTSTDLASAYGIAVTGTMVITTLIAFEVATHKWGWSFWKAAPLFGAFLIVDLTFFVTNATKVAHGGWVPLMMGGIIYLLLSTWAKGRKLLAERLKARSVPLADFIKMISEHPPRRVEGSAIYMTGDPSGVPVALLHNLKHNKVMHTQIAILTIVTKDIPTVAKPERVQIETLTPQFHRIVAHYGFMEIPKIKHILEACRQKGIPFSIQDTTFVLGRETILATGSPMMSLWREKIFTIMARNAERPTAFFKIPPNQVIEVGIQVEI